MHPIVIVPEWATTEAREKMEATVKAAVTNFRELAARSNVAQVHRDGHIIISSEHSYLYVVAPTEREADELWFELTGGDMNAAHFAIRDV